MMKKWFEWMIRWLDHFTCFITGWISVFEWISWMNDSMNRCHLEIRSRGCLNRDRDLLTINHAALLLPCRNSRNTSQTTETMFSHMDVKLADAHWGCAARGLSPAVCLWSCSGAESVSPHTGSSASGAAAGCSPAHRWVSAWSRSHTSGPQDRPVSWLRDEEPQVKRSVWMKGTDWTFVINAPFSSESESESTRLSSLSNSSSTLVSSSSSSSQTLSPWTSSWRGYMPSCTERSNLKTVFHTQQTTNNNYI